MSEGNKYNLSPDNLNARIYSLDDRLNMLEKAVKSLCEGKSGVEDWKEVRVEDGVSYISVIRSHEAGIRPFMLTASNADGEGFFYMSRADLKDLGEGLLRLYDRAGEEG